MEPARKHALLWGLIGALAFGVLYQGYAIVGSGTVDVAVLVGGMIGAGVASAVLTPRAERRLLVAME
ncbi:hypothetical protein [Salinarchaeum laminariae]|uniref:hypothetical protein n=1 Tax=Salinarchaeum laminariae TaxID=869888 RepID=UPI0020C0514C|nr:hypothetical protein [Salinarchaeum laminariae]